MFKFEFSFNAKNLEKVVLEKAAEAIVKRAQNVRCPEHGQYAHIVAPGTSTSNLD